MQLVSMASRRDDRVEKSVMMWKVELVELVDDLDVMPNRYSGPPGLLELLGSPYCNDILAKLYKA